MSEKPAELMSLAKAAETVGCNPATLRVAARQGKLEAIKVAKTWLVTPTALEFWRQNYWSGPRVRHSITP